MDIIILKSFLIALFLAPVFAYFSRTLFWVCISYILTIVIVAIVTADIN